MKRTQGTCVDGAAQSKHVNVWCDGVLEERLVRRVIVTSEAKASGALRGIASEFE